MAGRVSTEQRVVGAERALSIVDLDTLLAGSPTRDVRNWIESCGNCRKLFAITGGTGPQSKFEDIRCPVCHAFWGRSPSDHGFHTTALDAAGTGGISPETC